MKKLPTSWGKVAQWYDDLLDGQDTYQEKVIKPNLLRLAAIKNGESILDVGCGQGYFSREFAKLGAKIVGIDVAEQLIEIAKSKAGANETYMVLSAEHMKSLKDAQFNIAVCVLALQNIKDMQAAILEMGRVVKPNGRTVLVLNHPAFRIPTASAWGYDEQAKTQYRRVDKYLSEISQKVDMTQGQTDTRKKIFTASFHHPLQVYFKAFTKAGFAVTKLEEWISHKLSDTGPRKLAEDIARKEIPLFLALELKKV